MDMLELLNQGRADQASLLFEHGTPLPDAHQHPFLLNVFLSQSKTWAVHHLSGREAHPFYAQRMQIARLMMEQGFLLKPLADGHKTARREEHEIELLCRHYLSGGMGDLLEIPSQEARDRVACLKLYLQNANETLVHTHKGLSKEVFSMVAYAEPNGFTQCLVEHGMFDEALLRENPEILRKNLLRQASQIAKSNAHSSDFASPNRMVTSCVIERCLTLGILNFAHMKQEGFTLLDVPSSASLTLRMMQEEGYMLPRMDAKTLDALRPTWGYMWSDEQLRVWAERDPHGLIGLAPLLRKENVGILLVRKNFSHLDAFEVASALEHVRVLNEVLDHAQAHVLKETLKENIPLKAQGHPHKM